MKIPCHSSKHLHLEWVPPARTPALELQGSCKDQRRQREAEVTNQTEKATLEPTDSRTVRGQSVVIPAIGNELLNGSEELINESAKLASTEVCVGVTHPRKRNSVFITKTSTAKDASATPAWPSAGPGGREGLSSSEDALCPAGGLNNPAQGGLASAIPLPLPGGDNSPSEPRRDLAAAARAAVLSRGSEVPQWPHSPGSSFPASAGLSWCWGAAGDVGALHAQLGSVRMCWGLLGGHSFLRALLRGSECFRTLGRKRSLEGTKNATLHFNLDHTGSGPSLGPTDSVPGAGS